MNHDREDPLLDACLEEVLGGRTPPDLSARILSAWSSRREPVNSHGGAQSVEAGQNFPTIGTANPWATPAHYSEPPRAGLPVPPPLAENTAPIPAKPRATSHRRRRSAGWLPFAAAASVALVGLALGIAAVRFTLIRDGNPERLAEHNGVREGHVPVPPAPSNVEGEGLETRLPGHGESEGGRIGHFDSLPDFAQSDSRPHPNSATNRAPTSIGRRQQVRVDQVVLASISAELRREWERKGVQPAPRAEDSEWCRRLFLRMLGRIPTAAELESFLARSESQRRTELLNQLTGEAYAEEFARYWAGLLTNHLIGRRGEALERNGNAEREGTDREALIAYLRRALRENRPYDQLTRELITASGVPTANSPEHNGAVNFLLAWHDERNIQPTTRVAQVFLGQRLHCAQCHDDPGTDTPQRRFWTFNAFFRQMVVERVPGRELGAQGAGIRLIDRDFFGEGRTASPDEAELYYEEPGGELRAAYPEFLDGVPLATRGGRVEEVNRRHELAELVVASPQFSLTAVNWIWAHFLGYGFTRPVDDLGPHNPSSHPELWNELAEEFVARDFDLKQLVRLIAASEAFALSGQVKAENRLDMPEYGVPPLFARYYNRSAAGEPLGDALRLAASDLQGGGVENFLQANRGALGRVENGSGRSESLIARDFRFSAHGGVTGHDLAKFAANERLSFEQKVEHLFLAALSRRPERHELALAMRLYESSGRRVEVTLTALWGALLDSEEFRENP